MDMISICFADIGFKTRGSLCVRARGRHPHTRHLPRPSRSLLPRSQRMLCLRAQALTTQRRPPRLHHPISPDRRTCLRAQGSPTHMDAPAHHPLHPGIVAEATKAIRADRPAGHSSRVMQILPVFIGNGQPPLPVPTMLSSSNHALLSQFRSTIVIPFHATRFLFRYRMCSSSFIFTCCCIPSHRHTHPSDIIYCKGYAVHCMCLCIVLRIVSERTLHSHPRHCLYFISSSIASQSRITSTRILLPRSNSPITPYDVFSYVYLFLFILSYSSMPSSSALN